MSLPLHHDFPRLINMHLAILFDRMRARPAFSAALVAGTVGLTLVPWAVGNYRQFKALGKNGLPPGGWLIATCLKPFERETTSTKEYDQDGNKETWLKGGEGKDEIPYRNRSRPKTGWHCVPHRQVEQITESKEIQEVSI